MLFMERSNLGFRRCERIEVFYAYLYKPVLCGPVLDKARNRKSNCVVRETSPARAIANKHRLRLDTLNPSGEDGQVKIKDGFYRHHFLIPFETEKVAISCGGLGCSGNLIVPFISVRFQGRVSEKKGEIRLINDIGLELYQRS